jgi:hypothetical protein
LRQAFAASLTWSIAHLVRAFGLPRTSGAAKPSKPASKVGLTATSWPWRWVESSVIDSSCSSTMPFTSSQ